jgi:curved DNA-binding protein
MKFKDYYRIIGVPPEATADEIKIAYRKLARKYHPDVNKAADAEKLFTDLGEANEALKDPARRAAYDELRAGGWKEGQEIDAPQRCLLYTSPSPRDH